MLTRIAVVLATAFWLTMNILLWRAEYGGRGSRGSLLAPHVVSEKILTAPDTSSLGIYHQGRKVGFCHWHTSIGEALTHLKEEDTRPEGMVQRVEGYRIGLEGNVMLGDKNQRVRFDCSLALNTDFAWEQFGLKVAVRPTAWEVSAVAAEEKLRFTVEEGDVQEVREFRFSELESPEALLNELAGPLVGTLVSGLGLPLTSVNAAQLASALKWEARHSTLGIGHSQVRAYRMQGQFLDRYQAVIYVSRVGEILRVELPDGWLLLNDQLSDL